MKAGILGLMVAAAVAVRAENWPQWRGEAGTGVSLTLEAPTELKPGENLAW